MAIIKIEVIEGNADIDYTNHYNQMIVAALEPEHLKILGQLKKCLIIKPGESVCFHSKYLYLSIPDKPPRFIFPKDKDSLKKKPRKIIFTLGGKDGS